MEILALEQICLTGAPVHVEARGGLPRAALRAFSPRVVLPRFAELAPALRGEQVGKRCVTMSL